MKNFLKKILTVLIVMMIATALSSCGSGDSTSTTGLKTYDGSIFTIGIDPTWKIITPTDFYPEVPKETLVAFTSPEAYDGFFININVIKEDLKSEVTSVDYARANITLAGQNLTDYKKTQEAQVDLNGTPAMVHIFEARLNPTEKLTRFIQLYVAKGKTGYIISGGMLPTTPQNIRDAVGASVTSFRLK